MVRTINLYVKTQIAKVYKCALSYGGYSLRQGVLAEIIIFRFQETILKPPAL